MKYYSDKIRSQKPRIKEEITQKTWNGIIAAVKKRVVDSSFGYGFPESCPDGNVICGCDVRSFAMAFNSEIHDIVWPINENQETPSTLSILDFVQFCYHNVGMPIKLDYHPHFKHSHLDFDNEEGKYLFRKDINRIFERNGIAYELTLDGEIVRLVDQVLQESIKISKYQTGDAELDKMLDDARTKFLNPDLNIRKESIKTLWDAFERLKTIELSKNKKASVNIILDKTANEPNFRKALEEESKKLTNIGNEFLIRHTETNKIPIKDRYHVDYLFHRLYAFIHLILSKTERL